MKETSQIVDAQAGHWVQRLPAPMRPYAQLMRLDRPIGWWLLLLPCWWGLTLAQIAAGGGLPDLKFAVLFLVGAIIMRGAGCTLNDIVDRKIDSAVERTRARPIASGQVSVRAAFIFLVLQSLAGLLILLQFNWLTIETAIASLVIVAIYPFMKRVTYWPQIVLGLAFNWGALLGWTAIHDNFSYAAVSLYLGGVFWTLAYDTIYAHQDKDDDALIGVKSTALKLGAATPAWLVVFFSSSLILIDLSLWLVAAPLPTHIGVAGAALHATWQILRFDGNDPTLCLKLFRANRMLGLLVLFGLLIGSIIL
jgi:4-hydroxybenzoate polyprenyltransferase